MTNAKAHQIANGDRLVIENPGESEEWIESDRVIEIKQ